MALLKRSYDEALRLLKDHRPAMDKIAAYLIQKGKPLLAKSL